MPTEQEIKTAQKQGTQLETDGEGRETGAKTVNPIGAVLTRQEEKNPFIDSLIYNPNQIHNVLKRGERGDLGGMLNMYQRMKEQDSSLASANQTRKMTLRRAKSIITPPEGYEDDEGALFAVEYLKAVLSGLSGYSGIHPLLVDGAIDGFKALEIEWRGVVPVALHETPNDGWRWWQGALQYQNMAMQWQDVPPDKFIIHSPRGNSPDMMRRGVMRTLSYIWVLKHYATRDWAAFVEVFGAPTRLAKVPNDWDKDDPRLDGLTDALAAMGSDGYGAFNEEIEIILLAAQQAGQSAHPVFIQWCDQQFAKGFLGQTLTSDTTGRVGSYALGKIHNETKLDISQADVDDENETLRRDLFAPIIGYGIGWDAIVPVMTSVIEDAEQEQRDAEKLKIAVNDLGLDVPSVEAYRLLRIRPPEEGEEILPGAAQTSDPFMPTAQATEQPHGIACAAEGAQDEMTVALDALANFSSEQWSEVNSQFVMDSVLTMVRANPDLTVAQALERLPALYPGLPVEEFQTAVDEAMVAAATNGLIEIDAEADHPDADRVDGFKREATGEGSDRA